MPTASIVIPAYNVAATIRATVESALAQSFDNFEVIVVDDGSQDETPEVLASFGDRIRVLRGAGRGPSAARNLGAGVARSDALAFLDHDDVEKDFDAAKGEKEDREQEDR